MERELMKLEVLKNETMSKLNELFRRKVQLDEETKENEVQLQFHRGTLQGLNAAQIVIKEVEQAERIEAMRAKKAELVSVPSGDCGKEEVKVSKVKA
mgnify:CR=1 FL=1